MLARAKDTASSNPMAAPVPRSSRVRSRPRAASTSFTRFAQSLEDEEIATTLPLCGAAVGLAVSTGGAASRKAAYAAACNTPGNLGPVLCQRTRTPSEAFKPSAADS